jgi:hypothetical protein
LALATPTSLSPAAALACSTALSIPSVTKIIDESSRGQPSGMLWVTTKVGTPIGWCPSQPAALSKLRRPEISAPTFESASRSSAALASEVWNVTFGSAVGTATSPLKYQPKRSLIPPEGSAM